MPASKFDRINSGDEALDRVQGNVAKAFDSMLGNPFLTGQIVGPFVIASAAGMTPVPHLLGRVPIGFVVVSPMSSHGNDIYARPTTPFDDKFIYLSNNATDTMIYLWVF